jgi:hypothetical protein
MSKHWAIDTVACRGRSPAHGRWRRMTAAAA